MGHVAVLLSLMLSTTIQADPITGFVGETPSCDPVTDILSAVHLHQHKESPFRQYRHPHLCV
jgi:hypothetical protein